MTTARVQSTYVDIVVKPAPAARIQTTYVDIVVFPALNPWIIGMLLTSD